MQTPQARVLQRTLEGGHDVPDAKLIERLPRTRDNAAKALLLADLGLVFDNASVDKPFQLSAVWKHGHHVALAAT